MQKERLKLRMKPSTKARGKRGGGQTGYPRREGTPREGDQACDPLWLVCCWQTPLTKAGDNNMWSYGVTKEARNTATHNNTLLIITFRRNNILTNAIILANVVTSEKPNAVTHKVSPLFHTFNVNERGGWLSTFGKWMKNLPDNVRRGYI